MKKKIMWLVVSCLMVVALVLASCGPAAVEEEEAAPPEKEEAVTVEEEAAPAEEEAATSEEEVVTEEETVPPTPAQTPAALLPVVKDAVLLATSQGISIIAEGGWSVLNEATGLPRNRVDSMAVDDQGCIWLGHGDGLSVLHEGQWTHYDRRQFDYSSIDAIAFDATGRAWVVTSKCLFALENAVWKAYDLSLSGLASEYMLLRDVAVDVDGRVWIATSNGVAMFDGSDWTPYDESSGLRSEGTSAIAIDREGKVWVARGDGVSAFDGSKWINYSAYRYGHYEADIYVPGLNARDLTVDEENNVWVACGSSVCVFDGSHWTTYTRGESGLIGGEGTTIAVDAQGRVWVGTSWEISVFDGDQWLTYTEATSGLVTNGIHAVAYTGAGPSLLPLPKGPRTGSASGKVTRNGAPVVSAEVNLAWEVPSLPVFVGPSPCKGEIYKVTTDSEGCFSFGDIPIGLYGLAIHTTEGEWYTFGGIGRRIRIVSGKNTDLGELNIKE